MVVFNYFVLGLSLVTPVKSLQSIPNFNIPSTCRQAPELPGNEVKNTYQECVHAETEAQKQLPGEWSKASASNKIVCSKEANDGSPSYVDLLSCIQMSNILKDKGDAIIDKKDYIETDITRP